MVQGGETASLGAWTAAAEGVACCFAGHRGSFWNWSSYKGQRCIPLNPWIQKIWCYLAASGCSGVVLGCSGSAAPTRQCVWFFWPAPRTLRPRWTRWTWAHNQYAYHHAACERLALTRCFTGGVLGCRPSNVATSHTKAEGATGGVWVREKSFSSFFGCKTK
jgi:hypothetical protein